MTTEDVMEAQDCYDCNDTRRVQVSTLAGVALALIRWSPDQWWLWFWGFFGVFSLAIMYLSPYVIEPLFFTLRPIQAEGVETEIRRLMERAGLRVDRVFQVDASKRSRHSNAYFSGIGRVKRIVLFDTLLEQMNREEVLAVLAHEAGHWKRRHLLKRIIATEGGALIAIYLAFQLVPWEGLPRTRGSHPGLAPPSPCHRGIPRGPHEE